jgi:hypothetical protein
MPSKYIIIKAYSETSSGRATVIWNVVDATDGYIYDTFGLRRDATEWIKRAIINQTI